MTVQAGTKVIIIGGGPSAGKFEYHAFQINSEAEATGEVYEHNSEWLRFKNAAGERTWLKASHYKVKEQPKDIQEEVDTDLPAKVLYAVFKNDEFYYSNEDRDSAREVKSALGGKAKGAKIFAYAAQKEIR